MWHGPAAGIARIAAINSDPAGAIQVHSCQARQIKVEAENLLGEAGRGGAIRTLDLLNPIQVRYQAALRPDPRAHLHVSRQG